MISTRFLPIGLLALAGSIASGADLRMKASTTWAENIGRSSSPVDWRDTPIAEASASASIGRSLARNLTASGTVEASGYVSPRFDQLNTTSLGVNGALQYKFGLGPMAPVLRGNAGLAERFAKISGDSGLVASAGVDVTQRIKDSMVAHLAADWYQQYARAEAFDTHSQRLIGELSWELVPNWQFTYGYGRQWTDFTATASSTVWNRAISGGLGPAIAAYYNTVPTFQTDAFGPGWTSYRVEGEAELWWLVLSPALTERTSLSFRFDSVFTKNIVNVKYRQNLWTVSVLHTF